jgi:hypothetical protein
MTFLLPHPETGEIVDRRDVPGTILELLRSPGHSQVRRVQKLGALRLRSGEVSIADPVSHLHKQPLVRGAPRGQHEVTLLCGEEPSEVGAVVVRFGEGEIVTVERAQGTWPYQDERTFSLPGGLGGIFDYAMASRLTPDGVREIASLVKLEDGQPGALISLPRVRTWNVALFRPSPAGDPFYSTWWALDGEGSPLALVVDCALFGQPAHAPRLSGMA